MAFNLIEFAGDWAENTSEYPQKLRKWADQLEQGQIQDFGGIQDQFNDQLNKSGSTIQSNLRESRFAGLGAQAGAWLSKPVNMFLAAGAVIGIIWGILSVSRKT